jgi:thiol-disulfide isomerase/thioredoxin
MLMPVDYRALAFAIIALSFILLLKFRTLQRARSLEGSKLEGVPKAILNSLGEKGLLYLYRPNCPWCAHQRPIIDEIKASGRIHVVELDISKNPEIARVLRVFGTPTMVLVEGGIIKKYLVGFQDEKKLTGIILGLKA